MGGKTSRTKGHSFEREVAIAFREVFPKAARQLEYQEGLGVDLANTGNLRIQCKRGKGYAPISKIEEAYGDGIPVLVTKADRKEALVALRLIDFIDILRRRIHGPFKEADHSESGSAGASSGSGEGEIGGQYPARQCLLCGTSFRTSRCPTCDAAFSG